MRQIFCFILIVIAGLQARAQNIDFAATVSYSYDKMPLEYVLEDLTERYGVNFSYSRQVLPLDLEITAEVEDEPFAQALEILFAGTPVIYGFMGDQLLLSIDPAAYADNEMATQVPDDSMVAVADEPVPNRPPATPVVGLGYTTHEFTMAAANQPAVSVDEDFIRDEQMRLMDEAERQAGAFEAQITLFPPVQATTQRSTFDPLNFSVNVLWGANNALDGFEMGGFANWIHTDAIGVQMALMYNGVAESVQGAQFAGLVNTAGTNVRGLQMAGLVNVAGTGDNVQFAGLANYIHGRSLAQVSTLLNMGNTVDHVQLSVLCNTAHKSKVQIGLFNFADSVTTSVGLFSYARNGYRALEIAGEEAMHLNLNYRMGVRAFYNIFHLSSTYDFKSWAFGYGIGTSLRTGPRNFFQLEIMARHISENEGWTDVTNMIGQFKLLFDARLGKRARISFGPSYNVSVSKLYDPDTNTYGTSLAPSWTFYDRTALDSNGENVNVKMWIGFHVGIRLNSKEELPKTFYDMN